MISSVLPVIANMITSVLDLFFDIINQLGSFSLIFGAFIIFTIYRFLLRPIIGGSAGKSDSVKKVRGGNDNG